MKIRVSIAFNLCKNEIKVKKMKIARRNIWTTTLESSACMRYRQIMKTNN